jgi:hypothetical protein
MTEIYEVKTSGARQSLYAAVGQILSHSVGAAADVKRILVIPEGAIPDDLERCLAEFAIDTRRFRLIGAKRKTVSLIG